MSGPDLTDNGPAQVLVLHDAHARLETDRLVVAGGGHAEVFAEDDQTLVQVAAGSPDSVALLRAALSSPALQVHGELLDAVVVCGGGYDRYVLSADLEHRWLFTRHWDRRAGGGAPTVALVGHSPFRHETSPDDTGPRSALDTALQLLRDTVGAPDTLHVTNVFTRRTRQNDDITGAEEDRRPDPGIATEKLREADAILAAWGAVPEAGAGAVDDTIATLQACRDAGARILVRSHGGTIETSGSPPQPSARGVVRRGTRLVDAPAEWLWGGRLDA